MRTAWLLFLLVIAGIPVADATCEYRPEWRGRDTASYVADANACLTGLKPGFWIEEEVERDVFNRVNAARQDAGLAPLQLREGLLPAARLHSFDMGQDRFFEHKGPDGRTVSDRVAALDRTLIHSEVRENIAAIEGDFDWSDTARILHNILYDSEGHRENMLSPTVTHMAIGVARSEKGAWITQIFVREEGRFDQPVATQFAAATPSSPSATMSEWSFRNLALNNGETEHPLTDIPPGMRGDARLLVIGTQPIDERSYRIINLAGPSITITD